MSHEIFDTLARMKAKINGIVAKCMAEVGITPWLTWASLAASREGEGARSNAKEARELFGKVCGARHHHRAPNGGNIYRQSQRAYRARIEILLYIALRIGFTSAGRGCWYFCACIACRGARGHDPIARAARARWRKCLNKRIIFGGNVFSPMLLHLLLRHAVIIIFEKQSKLGNFSADGCHEPRMAGGRLCVRGITIISHRIMK